jgi:predicted AlkP superfamily phosphohydrolase/phosphomutase
MQKNAKKIVIIGLDGATWKIIEPLEREGKLPNISYLMKNGVYGTLKSYEPMFSPSVWTSIASGVTPKKHGITNFFNTAHDIRTKRLWNILSDHGDTVGIVGWLVTWPPDDVHGFLIPDWLARDTETIPKEYAFLKELEQAEQVRKERTWQYFYKLGLRCLANGISFKTVIQSALVAGYERIYKPADKDIYYRKKIIRQRLYRDAFIHLYEQYVPDVAAFVIVETDALSHNYWKYMEPENFTGVSGQDIMKYSNVIKDIYIEADKTIGKILKCTDKDSTVVIVSDHGFKADTKCTPDANGLKIDEFLGLVKIPEIERAIYLSYEVFLHLKQGLSQDATDEVARMLGKICLKKNGERLFTVIKFNDQTLRLIINNLGDVSPQSEVNLPGSSCRYSDIIEIRNTDVSGTHDLDGVIIMKGPDIKRGHVISGATVLDVTPTLLALKGLPVGRDMDGSVLEDVFTEKYLVGNPVDFIETYNEEGAKKERANTGQGEALIKSKLKELGYF